MSLSRTLLAVMLCASGCAESLFYQPSTTPFRTPADQEDVFFVTPDGKRLHGLFAASGETPGPAVLLLHGNAGNVSSRAAMVRRLREAGFSALVFDYRGYGRSDPPQGRYTRDLLLTDAEAALRYLRSRPEVDRQRIALVGSSLGVAFATALGARHPEVRALVAMSGFSTWQGIAHDLAPVVGGAFVPPGLDPAVLAGELTMPLLILHSVEDELIPVEHAERIYQVARERDVDAQLHILRRGAHNSAFVGERREVVEAFLHQHL